MVMDFRRGQQRNYTPLRINGTVGERVCSFKYLGVHISEDLTRTTHIETPQVQHKSLRYNTLSILIIISKA